MSIRVTGDTAPAVGAFDRIANGMQAALMAAVVDSADVVTEHIQREIFRSFTRGKGRLAKSFKTRALRGGDPAALSRSFRKYAKILDEGGAIRAKKGKYLAIPLPGSKRRTKSYKDQLFFHKTRRGGVLLHRVSKKPLFTLVPSTRIRGRQYVSIAEKAARPEVEAAFARVLGVLTERSSRRLGR